MYSKGEGTRAELQEVYWIWRYNGQWSPQVLKPKQIERVPVDDQGAHGAARAAW